MQRFQLCSAALSIVFLAGSLCLLANPQTHAQPTIEFTLVPPAGEGNAIRLETIEGRVKGAQPGQRIVLFSNSTGAWWVQPTASRPFTEIRPDSHWKGFTHPGNIYAALLVDAQYMPSKKMQELPAKGGPILALATAMGPPATPPKIIQFSGYPWRVREAGRSQAGHINFYDPSNAWTGPDGFLHLQVKRRGDQWTCAEVTLSRGLGFGSYRFVIRDVSHFEPAAVLGVGPAAKMAIEISRWDRPEDKNAQYVITPYSVPANTVRFVAPSGTLTHLLNWEQDRVTFRTLRGSSLKVDRAALFEHTFTSGVQSPGNEGVSLNLYFSGNAASPLTHEFEVIVEKFEFLP